MTSPNVPSMNAMVDSITDAVENAIIRGNQSGGVSRFMVQGAVRRALCDIHNHRIPSRRSNGHREHRSSALQIAQTPALVRNVERAPPPPSVAPLQLLPPRNGGDGTMAARRAAPLFPNRDADAERWPPGFAYDISVVPPPPLLHLLPRSLADIVTHGRNNLPSGSTLGAGFVSSEEGAFPRL